MKYSIVNGERSEALPSLYGRCQACDRPTIAKCGDVKVWHWAHHGKRCDPWWENETDWHRNWKCQFPSGWQETIHRDENGEKHIADVKTAQGWVIEFQHSYLNPEERMARNAFYKKLIWVVDGSRRSRDKKQFLDMINNARHLCIEPVVKVNSSYDCTLLSEWYGFQMPVFFDFGEELLYCLLPVFIGSRNYFVEFPRRLFVELLNKQADQTEHTFEDCLRKLNLFASEHRRNELYRFKHNIFGQSTAMLTQNQIDICRQTYDHFIRLHDRFKLVMKPYFEST